MKSLEEKRTGRRFTDHSESFDTVIGAEVGVKGDLLGVCNVEVRGSMEGRIDVKGLVRIRHGGRMKGEINATGVVVEGELEGNIVASKKVDLRETCRLDGDITAGAIAAAEGSFFRGKISMPGSKSDAEVVKYREKRQESDGAAADDQKEPTPE